MIASPSRFLGSRREDSTVNRTGSLAADRTVYQPDRAGTRPLRSLGDAERLRDFLLYFVIRELFVRIVEGKPLDLLAVGAEQEHGRYRDDVQSLEGGVLGLVEDEVGESGP